MRKPKLVEKVSLKAKPENYVLTEITSICPENRTFVISEKAQIVDAGTDKVENIVSIPSLFTLAKSAVLSASTKTVLNPFYMQLTAPLAQIWWKIRPQKKNWASVRSVQNPRVSAAIEFCTDSRMPIIDRSGRNVNFSAHRLQFLSLYPQFQPKPIEESQRNLAGGVRGEGIVDTPRCESAKKNGRGRRHRK
jgi:hypothetical protein